jgi:CDP-diacylglycerol--glycerol-3-phosphate 3-phosphatidyltransferase
VFVEDRVTVANLLTIARMAMAAAAAFLALDARAPAAAVALLVLAALLDAFDGWYARAFTQCSALGTHLDPLADKVLAAVIYAWVGVDADAAPVWSLIGVVMAREVGVTALRFHCRRRHGRFIPAGPLGRLKMFLQCTTGLAVLASTHWFDRAVPPPIVAASLVLVAGVSYASAVGYLRRWTQELRGRATPEPAGQELTARIERMASGG